MLIPQALDNQIIYHLAHDVSVNIEVLCALLEQGSDINEFTSQFTYNWAIWCHDTF